MANAIWHKGVLIPFWVIQILLTVILLGAGIASLYAAHVIASDEEINDTSNVVHLVNVAASIIVAITAVTLIFDITEIVLFSRSKLSPVTNIVFQCIKSLIWTVYFALAIATLARGGGAGISFILAAVLFLISLGQLIYASVIIHRHRKGTLYRGEYAPASTGNNYNMGYNAPPFHDPSSTYYSGSTGVKPDPFQDPSRSSLAGGMHTVYQPYQPQPYQSVSYPTAPGSYELQPQQAYGGHH